YGRTVTPAMNESTTDSASCPSPSARISSPRPSGPGPGGCWPRSSRPRSPPGWTVTPISRPSWTLWLAWTSWAILLHEDGFGRYSGIRDGTKVSRTRCARRSDRPRHRPALAVPRCWRLLPESVRQLKPGGFASPTRHTTADARRGHSPELAILLSLSARERF